MMKLETLVTKLENTIKSKEIYLESIGTAPSAARSIILFDIDELKKILKNAKAVQQQVEQLHADLDGFVHGSL